MYTNFVVDVEIMPYEVVGSPLYGNIFHIGPDIDTSNYVGISNPAMYVTRDNVVTVQNTGNSNPLVTGWRSLTGISVNKWTKFHFRQLKNVLVPEEYHFQLFWDRNGVWELDREVKVNAPIELDNLVLHASSGDNHHVSMGLRNLKVMTFPEDGGSCTFNNADIVAECHCDEPFERVVDQRVTMCSRKLNLFEIKN